MTKSQSHTNISSWVIPSSNPLTEICRWDQAIIEGNINHHSPECIWNVSVINLDNIGNHFKNTK